MSEAATEARQTQIDIKISDLFHKHKRNLLLACSAAVVLAVASREESVKLPGMSSAIPTGIAFVFLALTILYFAFQYTAEYWVVWTRNSKMAATKSASDLDDAFQAYAEHLGALKGVVENAFVAIPRDVEKIREIEINLIDDVYKQKISGLHFEQLNELVSAALRSADDDDEGRRQREHLVQMVAQSVAVYAQNDFERGVQRITGSIADGKQIYERITAALESALPVLDSAITQNRELQRGFSRLSKFIYGSQRANLIVDGVVPLLMTVLSVAACIYGAS